jgi:tagatose 1,6-diphosphate aldolase
LSGGVDYAAFARQVKAACLEGASGFIAGRAVWQEGIPLPPEQRERWLREEGARRLEELGQIAEKYARPWRDFYPRIEQSVREGWYLEYGE